MIIQNIIHAWHESYQYIMDGEIETANYLHVLTDCNKIYTLDEKLNKWDEVKMPELPKIKLTWGGK